jgi:iron complex transport system ATP-binding protein
MTLRADKATIRYGAVRALTDFSLTLNAPEIVALIGPNGSGKSTALHALAGLAPLASGSVTVDGRPVSSWPRRALARRISLLPQAPIAPEAMTVDQLVRQGRFAHLGLFQPFTAKDTEAVAWALEHTGLVELADRDLRALSGGERQRAWIAAALAQEASTLLLDEPTSFLDIGHQIEVLELLCRLSKSRGVSVVLSIHDINHALAIAERVLLLDRGALRFEGRPEDLAAGALVGDVFAVKGRFTRSGAGAPIFHAAINRGTPLTQTGSHHVEG